MGEATLIVRSRKFMNHYRKEGKKEEMREEEREDKKEKKGRKGKTKIRNE